MIRTAILSSFVSLALLSPVSAQPAVSDPTQQALVHMLGEAQNREAQALVQAYTLKAQVDDLKRQAADAKKRAEDAEAKATAPAK